jgi:diacylglycerol kinase family enzyme
VTSEITLFVNPTAGRGRGAHVAQPAASALRAAGCAARTVLGEARTPPTPSHTRPSAVTAEGVTGYADGEPLGPLPLSVRCVRGAVSVVGP